jgi:hypothetical protein
LDRYVGSSSRGDRRSSLASGFRESREITRIPQMATQGWLVRPSMRAA